MKNLISYSVWGNNPMYWAGARRNIELTQQFFPGWIARFYVDRQCDEQFINSLLAPHVEIVLVDRVNAFDGMFWRFLGAVEAEVEIFLSRDCDSRFSNRELEALKEWLSSDKDFHIMRDHPYHKFPILGGMWGARNGLMKKIGLKNLISNWGKYERKGIDQDFLGEVVYPLIWRQAIEHSEFDISYKGAIKPFPTLRQNYEFVGDVFDENDRRDPVFWKLIKDYKN